MACYTSLLKSYYDILLYIGNGALTEKKCFCCVFELKVGHFTLG